MSQAIDIARLAIRRLLRERSNLFFVFVFPLLLVLLVGVSFGGSSTVALQVVGPADEPLVDAIVAAIDDSDVLSASRVSTRDLAMDALSRGRADGVVVLGRGATAALEQGQPFEVELALRDEARGASPALDAALAEVESAHRAVALARQMGSSTASVDDLPAGGVRPVIEVRTVAVGDGRDLAFANLGRFDLGATSQLVLFVFITTVGGATRIVESRELGVTQRILAGPVTTSTIILGEGLGRFAVALFQSAWVVAGALLLFNVNWGNPPAALLVIAAFSAAAAAAGLLLGAVARNVSQASGVAVLVSLTMAALGGSMAPLDIFSEGLRRVAHITPHAWANDAFAELTRREGGIGDVAGEVAVLLGFALVLGTLAARRLRATITAG